jgi:hypothetical protein
MKNVLILGLYFILLTLSCKTTSSLKPNELSKLNGRWKAPCQEPFGRPEDLECPIAIWFFRISVDVNTGIGEEVEEEGNIKTPIKVFKSNDKLMIIYYTASGQEELTGEIVQLDEKELRVKVDAHKFYLVYKKAM